MLLLNQYYAPDEAATAQMLADLGEGLVAAGCEVHAICCDRSYADPSRRYAARETLRGVTIRRAHSTGFGRSSKLGRLTDYATFLASAALALLFGPRPDVVISLSTPPLIALLGTTLGRLRGARTIFWSMDVYPDIAYALGAIRETSLAGRLVALLARLTHRLPDTVVALGETMARRLEAGGARNVTVIHNWADETAITPRPPNESALRAEWNWSDRFVVMYSGNMGLAHEFETVLNGISNFEFRISNLKADNARDGAVSDLKQARGTSNFEFRISNFTAGSRDDLELDSIERDAPQVASDAARADDQIRNSQFEIRNPPVLLAFVGGGPRRAEVEARALELGLSNPKFEIRNSKCPVSVEFRPYVDRSRLGDSLTAADVHLVTMRERVAGLIVPSKIYGILAAGRPVIYVGPAEGEIHEILVEGSCGIRVPLGDHAAFAGAVERYRNDPALREEHGRNARALFEKRFTRARGIEEWRRVVGT